MPDSVDEGVPKAVIHCTAALATRKGARQVASDTDEHRSPVAWVQSAAAGSGTHIVHAICDDTNWTMPSPSLDDTGGCGGLVLEHSSAA